MILDSKNIQYNIIDIAEPGKENEKEFMQEHSKLKDSKYPLPPQIFNDDHYCGVRYFITFYISYSLFRDWKLIDEVIGLIVHAI